VQKLEDVDLSFDADLQAEQHSVKVTHRAAVQQLGCLLLPVQVGSVVGCCQGRWPAAGRGRGNRRGWKSLCCRRSQGEPEEAQQALKTVTVF
ncbi:hypothetical protein XENOCAPTIV_027597, partial [Xenoophorus captivus]